MSLPKPLMFTIGLIDQITKPIAKISQQLNGLSANYQQGTMQMAAGVGGVVASGYALQRALMPAIEMNRSLGEVRSLGVQDSALKMLTDNAYEYAIKYGESASAFVRSSYDIQSAIDGLNDSDLSRFTMASNVLAKATKADAATITSYMGTMYGIFKNDALAMGQGEWVDRLTGMTATAVQVFKTDGKKMSDAFGALGASAGLAPLQEQMAILGTLQATMGGSESATQYRAFLAGVGKAQDELNLKFTDAHGQMLHVVDILNKIKGKYGEVLTVADQDQLAKAFGSRQAVAMIQLLLNDIDGLSGSIDSLGKVKGMQQAEIMAAAMVDQSQRLAESWFVIRAAFGNAILPVFNGFVGWIADMGRKVIWFTSLFPNITRWLGYVAIGFVLAVAAGGLFTLMMGASKMAMVAWTGATMAMQGVVWLLNGGLAVLRTAMLAVNIAMYANPIGLVIGAIAALIAIIAAAVYYFDDLRNYMAQTAWGQPILFAIDAIADLLKTLAGIAAGVFSVFFSVLKVVWSVLRPIASFLLDVLVVAFKVVGAIAGFVFGAIAYTIGAIVHSINWLASVIHHGFSIAFEFVGEAWQALVDMFGNFEWFNNLLSAATAVGEFMASLWNGIKEAFGAAWSWIVDKLNKLPGINIKTNVLPDGLDAPELAGNPDNASSIGAIAPIRSSVPRGGVSQQIANANNSKSTTIGSIQIYPQKVDTDFANYVEMHA
ncbi:phage tail tape measure protein [Alkalimonas mucilaginosa]|uniref:Phage tail tape measure protein n=1 Tax=Alkalimonas mucilaginosa TaxID=3057676 RepID=A0ABU7JD17_9GAMM|nr:phage tail tape measure protein [Alkalimonas sp. MEB004]MEE2023592.1 phage tail tape measure protein [Alkalimonas sp. MEB004]